MILQTLDIADNCQGIYHEGEFLFSEYDKKLLDYSTAWKHTPMMQHSNIKKYLYILTRGRPLQEYSPDKDRFLEIQELIFAHRKALDTANVNLQGMCFYDAIPEHILTNWFDTKLEALEVIESTCFAEDDYDILLKAHFLASAIRRRKITYKSEKRVINYNIFGSSTGRLTTNKGSLPIHNIKKEQRSDIVPSNSAFVEIDFNAAEIRTLLALSGREQPQDDIHEWISKEVFLGKHGREESKVKLFSWLYNISASDTDLAKFFSREIFRDFYDREKSTLKTPFGRSLQVEERKAQNYLLQSTTSDIVVENTFKILKLLRERKSQIAFTLHDSVVIDLDLEDLHLLKTIKNVFESTRWGNFKSNVKIGKNFGNMKEFKI